MDKLKFFRELRGEHSFDGWQELTGINYATQKKWEKGVAEPSAGSINKLADALGWSDEERMALMPEPAGEGLSAEFERHMQFLRLTDAETAKILGISASRISAWRNGELSKLGEKLVREFLKMGKEEAEKRLEEKQPMTDEPERERKKIPYELIYELEGNPKTEREYNPLNKVPDDNETLKKIQEAMK